MTVELNSAEQRLLVEVLEDYIDSIKRDLEPEDDSPGINPEWKAWQKELRELLETARGLLQRILTA